MSCLLVDQTLNLRKNGYVGRIGYSNQHTIKCVDDGLTHYRIKVAKTSAYVCVQKTYVSTINLLAIPTSPNIVNVFVACTWSVLHTLNHFSCAKIDSLRVIAWFCVVQPVLIGPNP